MNVESHEIVQIVWSILSGFCGILLVVISYFLRAVYVNFTKRLDNLEKSLGDFLVEIKSSNVITKQNTEEISILRQRYHDLSNDIHVLGLQQAKCKAICKEK